MVSSRIICFGAPKEAALYFDKVLPVDLMSPSLMYHSSFADASIDKDALLSVYVPHMGDELFFPVLRSILECDDTAIGAYLDQTFIASSYFMSAIAIAAKDADNSEWPVFENFALATTAGIDQKYLNSLRKAIELGKLSRKHLNQMNVQLNRCIYKSGFSGFPAWECENSLSIFGMRRLPVIEDDRFFSSISQLKMIDVKRTSWEQIIELRKDVQARAALKELRLFFEDNFVGKDASYITDTLQSRIYKHEMALKIWGFETVVSSLGVAFSKDSVLAMSIGGVSAALFGAPLSVASGTALTIAAGSCIVEIGKSLITRKKLSVDNPTRYLVDIRNKLQG